MGISKTLIKNARIFPGVENGQAKPVIEAGCALIKGNRFAYVGPEEACPAGRTEKVIDAGGRLLMPALVNAHTHSAMTLLRGVGGEKPLEVWLREHIFPLEERLVAQQARAGVALAMLEYLACGVTTINDMYMFPEETVKVVMEAGGRAMISNACVDFGKGEAQLADALAFHRDYHGAEEGRIRASVSVHAEYTTTPELVKKLVRATEGLDNIQHLHLSETQQEAAACRQRHGMSPVQYFHHLGLFNGPAVAAHCVAVDEEDMALLAQDGVRVAHAVISNLKLGSGIAPVPEMLSRGIPLTLGTDGAASNDNLDLWEEIKLTALLHKGAGRDATLISPAQVLEAATLGGARALGFDGLGLICEGWLADCVLMDLSLPNTLPAHDIPATLVYAAGSRNVSMTMSAGRVLYQDGEYLSLDEEKIKTRARQSAGELLGRDFSV